MFEHVRQARGFSGLEGTGLASNSNCIALSCPAMVIIMSSFISLHRFMSLLYAGSWNANASCIAKHAWKYLGFKVQLSQRAGKSCVKNHGTPWDASCHLLLMQLRHTERSNHSSTARPCAIKQNGWTFNRVADTRSKLHHCFKKEISRQCKQLSNAGVWVIWQYTSKEHKVT